MIVDLAELAGLLQRLVDTRRVVGVESDHAVDLGMGGQRVLDIALGARLVDVVAAHVDERDLRALDRLLDALDALRRCRRRAGRRSPCTCRHSAAPSASVRPPACRHRCWSSRYRRRACCSGASLSVVNSAICAPMRLRASLDGLRIDRADHDAGDAGGHEVVHQAVLDRGRGLLRIFEDELVVRQLGLRLLDAGFRRLPEIGSAVDDEGQGFLVRGLRRSGKAHQSSSRDSGNQKLVHDRFLPFTSATTRSSADSRSTGRPNCIAIEEALPLALCAGRVASRPGYHKGAKPPPGASTSPGAGGEREPPSRGKRASYPGIAGRRPHRQSGRPASGYAERAGSRTCILARKSCSECPQRAKQREYGEVPTTTTTL